MNRLELIIIIIICSVFKFAKISKVCSLTGFIKMVHFGLKCLWKKRILDKNTKVQKCILPFIVVYREKSNLSMFCTPSLHRTANKPASCRMAKNHCFFSWNMQISNVLVAIIFGQGPYSYVSLVIQIIHEK